MNRPSWLRRAREDSAAIGMVIGVGCGALTWAALLLIGPQLLACGMRRCPTCTPAGLIAFWVLVPVAAWALFGQRPAPPARAAPPPARPHAPAPPPSTPGTPHDVPKVADR